MEKGRGVGGVAVGRSGTREGPTAVVARGRGSSCPKHILSFAQSNFRPRTIGVR
jgi:hypothetical protein